MRFSDRVYGVRACIATFLFIGNAQGKSTEKMWQYKT